MTLKTAQLRRNPQAAWQRVEENIVVVTPKTRQIHILSGCATDLWDLTETPFSLAAIHAEICDRYDVDPQTVHTDLAAAVRQLCDGGILEEKVL